VQRPIERKEKYGGKSENANELTPLSFLEGV
jgi:hypothetical protein